MRAGVLAYIATMSTLFVLTGLVMALAFGPKVIPGKPVVGTDTTSCPATFDFGATAKPLGEGMALLNAARQAASADTRVTMAEVAAAAGWSDGWDRMVIVSTGIAVPKLNALSGAWSTCWRNIPESSRYGDWDRPSNVYLLFLQGDSPVQVIIGSPPPATEFRLGQARTAYRDSLFEPVHATGTSPYLNLVAAP